MKILKAVRKVPGGMMIVPLLLGAMVNTFFPSVLDIGGFSTAMWKTGANAILGVFLFCNGAQIKIRQAGSALAKGVGLTAVKFVIGAAIGILINKLFGEAGFLTISPLAAIAAITNSNGGLYSALASEYGDSTDVGAVSILSINDGPFLTMVALGASGIASIPYMALVATILPILVGFVLGNLDEEIAKFLEPGTVLLIPFFSFPLGAALNLGNLIKAGLPGLLLGVICLVTTGFGGYIVMKLLKAKNPGVGWAIGTTAGNAVGTPGFLLSIGATTAAVAEAATGQITGAIIVTAILCPLATHFFSKRESAKQAQ
ncbi:MAG: 2-keto-3-deoxygluconate permease [Christensenellaceae bacterium]|nr:2-keto-3-deoxygluconate permease [Christensenellaceae bacterium]